MRIYTVTVYCGQHDTYYVHADEVASAAKFALDRDDKLTRESEAEVDPYRRVKSVTEFCSEEQFVGPPASFVKRKSA